MSDGLAIAWLALCGFFFVLGWRGHRIHAENEARAVSDSQSKTKRGGQ